VIIEWSTSVAHQEATEAAMLDVATHIAEEHPEIRGVRLDRQIAGGLPHVTYRWEETFDSLAAFEALPDNPECAAVWVPIDQLAVPGSHRQSIWAGIERGR
jgi:hypothetical protein